MRKLMVLFSILFVLTTATYGKPRPEAVTMLVVPAHYSVLQVAMDIWQSYPGILLSYQTSDESDDPVLFAWNGKEWLFISCDDYLAGRFFSYPPERTVLVGPDDDLPPLLADGPPWCSYIVKIPALKTAELINSLGEVYPFDSRMWSWLSKRYKLKLVDINAPTSDVSWYDGTFVEKQQPDGTVEKIYIPPANRPKKEVDIEFLEVKRNAPLGRIPLKAEPPRRVEMIDVDIEETEDGDFLSSEEKIVVETWETEEGNEVTATSAQAQQEVIAPEPKPPQAEQAEEKAVFFEYTEQDIKDIQDAK